MLYQSYPARGVHLKDFDTKWFSIVMSVSTAWAFNGGYINAVCIAGVWYAGLTHLTGSTTISAIRFINPAKPGQYTHWDLLGFIFAWAVGAFVSAAVMGKPRLRWGRLQGFLTLLHGLTLMAGWFFAPVPEENYMGVLGGMFVSFAMGMQNAITSLFSPFTLRTSHHSGTMLDIGIALGQIVHDRNLDNLWKLKIMVPNYLGFWIGALLGTVAWNSMAAGALLIPAGIAIAVSAITFGLCTFYCKFPDDNTKIYEEIDNEEPPYFSQDREVELEGSYHGGPDYDDDHMTYRKGYGATL
jgi:uncharacterized membrane protein YoaK (UPF0700 family)